MMLRVLTALLLGGLVGWERERVQRPAGFRTHMLVAAGSATFTIASVFGFDDLGTTRDPARLAAQIVSGVGFLGAGVIFRHHGSIRGLTTAASIWMVAAIGVLAGLGLYWVASFATMLTWFVLRILKAAESPEYPGKRATAATPVAAPRGAPAAPPEGPAEPPGDK